MKQLPKVRLKSDNLKLPPPWLTDDVASGLITVTDALIAASAGLPDAFIKSKSGETK